MNRDDIIRMAREVGILRTDLEVADTLRERNALCRLD